MRFLSSLILLVLMILGLSGLGMAADPIHVQTWGEYIMGDRDSRQDARALALYDAKRKALEQAGTMLSSTSTVKDFSLVSDEVVNKAVGRIKATVLEEKFELHGQTLKALVHINATVTPEDLEAEDLAVSTKQTTPTVSNNSGSGPSASLPQQGQAGNQQGQFPAQQHPQWENDGYRAQPAQPSGASVAGENFDKVIERTDVMIRKGNAVQALMVLREVEQRYRHRAEVHLQIAKAHKSLGNNRLAFGAANHACELGSKEGCKIAKEVRSSQSSDGGFPNMNNRFPPGARPFPPQGMPPGQYRRNTNENDRSW